MEVAVPSGATSSTSTIQPVSVAVVVAISASSPWPTTSRSSLSGALVHVSRPVALS
jgi:hypothetical protein